MSHTPRQTVLEARVAGLLLLLALLFPPLPSSAAAGQPSRPAVIVAANSPSFSLPPAASWWGKFYSFCENSLNSRTRMIQLGVLGMFFALLVMMKK